MSQGSRELTEKEEYEIAALSPAVTLTNQKVRREVYGSWLALYHPKFAGKQKRKILDLMISMSIKGGLSSKSLF